MYVRAGTVRAPRLTEGGPSWADSGVVDFAAGAGRFAIVILVVVVVPSVSADRGGEHARADNPADGGSAGQGPIEVGSLVEQGDCIGGVPSGAADRFIECPSLRL